MILRHIAALATAILLMAGAALANGIEVSNAVIRVTTPVAHAGGAYMDITNTGTTPDRLLSIRTEAARSAMIHENIVVDGVASMKHLENGIELRPGATIRLMQGGDHVMLMGIPAPLKDGAMVDLHLTFENAGTITLSVPVQIGF